MKIFVAPRFYIEEMLKKDPNWYIGKHIISIFSSGDVSPLPNELNILKLNFDDVSEKDNELTPMLFEGSIIFFDSDHARMIHEFIKPIKADDKKPFYIHCDAGISRSGAVGMLLNEWFNKFLMDNKEDDKAFKMNNPHILPNPLVARTLKNELFGQPFQKN